MTRAEYLERLRAALALMPAEEREAQLAYYEELFDDMLEDGMSEAEAAEHLGEPEAVAEELLAEIPMTTLVKRRMQAQGKPSALTVVLLVLGAPLWLPLLLSAFIILFSLIITLWALSLGLGIVLPAVGVSLIAVGLGTLFGRTALPLLIAVGGVLSGAGVLILGVMLMGVIMRGFVRLCRSIWRGFKRALMR